MFHVDRCDGKVQDQFPQKATDRILEVPRPAISTSAAKPESGDELLFTPCTAEVISSWAAQKRSSIALSCIRAMMGLYIADVWLILYEGCLCDYYPQEAKQKITS
jgi:hypothetical protein